MAEPTLGERVVRIETLQETHIDAFDEFKVRDAEDKRLIRDAIKAQADATQKLTDRVGQVVAGLIALMGLLTILPRIKELLGL